MRSIPYPNMNKTKEILENIDVTFYMMNEQGIDGESAFTAEDVQNILEEFLDYIKEKLLK